MNEKLARTKMKVEDFTKKHKKELIIAGGLVLSGAVGWKLSERRFKEAVFLDEDIKELILDAEEYGSYGMFTAQINDECKGLFPEQLGELGKNMLEVGCSKDRLVTHVVAFVK